MKLEHSIVMVLMLTAGACTTRDGVEVQSQHELDGRYAPSHSVYYRYMLSEYGPKFAKEENARWATDRTRMRIEGGQCVVTHGTNTSAKGRVEIHGDFLLLWTGSGTNAWCQPAYVNSSRRIVFGPGWEWEKIEDANQAAQGAAPGAAAPSH